MGQPPSAFNLGCLVLVICILAWNYGGPWQSNKHLIGILAPIRWLVRQNYQTRGLRKRRGRCRVEIHGANRRCKVKKHPLHPPKIFPRAIRRRLQIDETVHVEVVRSTSPSNKKKNHYCSQEGQISCANRDIMKRQPIESRLVVVFLCGTASSTKLKA